VQEAWDGAGEQNVSVAGKAGRATKGWEGGRAAFAPGRWWCSGPRAAGVGARPACPGNCAALQMHLQRNDEHPEAIYASTPSSAHPAPSTRPPLPTAPNAGRLLMLTHPLNHAPERIHLPPKTAHHSPPTDCSVNPPGPAQRCQSPLPQITAGTHLAIVLSM
jgi:hypothetical protein